MKTRLTLLALVAIATSAMADKKQYVDLGLPSGTLWATCNVGAESPNEIGEYFAWGETTPKKDTNGNYTAYSWSVYQHANGERDKLTKYCDKSERGNNGYTDTLRTLEASDDAAQANWGDTWRMPTHADFQELIDHCTWTWVYTGYLVQSKTTDASIFLPVTGFRYNSELHTPEEGAYWAATLDDDDTPADVSSLVFDENGKQVTVDNGRCYGRAVRAVFKPEYVDLGLTSGTLWASCNVGATSPEETGDYFAWGETTPKESYDEDNYTYTDNPSVLPASADAATANWGGKWRMPTRNDIQELINECTWTWDTEKIGYTVTGKNGKSIFLVAAGCRYGTDLSYINYWGYYRSSSLYRSGYSYDLFFHESKREDSYGTCYYGKPVRPVQSVEKHTITVTAGEGGTVTGDGEYPVNRTATLMATPNEGYIFQQWSDGNTENPRTITVNKATAAVEYVAYFIERGPATAVETVSHSVSGEVQKVFENGTIYILRNNEKYTIDGRKVE